MARNICYNGFKVGFLPVFSEIFSADRLDQATQTEKSTGFSNITPETGWSRLKRMFEVDEFGNVTKELNSIIQTTYLSMFLGAVYGGSMEGKKAYEAFMRNNEATKFKTALEAKRKLQDTVTLAMGKGAFKFGWRLTVFTVSYVGISTMIQVYRNKYGIMEYVGAGALTGFIYKFNDGPKAWIVGSGLGSLLGIFCGCVTTGLLKLSGVSMDETRLWQNKITESRSQYIKDGIAKHLEEEDHAVIKLHDLEVGEIGKTLENLENSDRKNFVDLNVE